VGDVDAEFLGFDEGIDEVVLLGVEDEFGLWTWVRDWYFIGAAF
jgi:hypothetical protein